VTDPLGTPADLDVHSEEVPEPDSIKGKRKRGCFVLGLLSLGIGTIVILAISYLISPQVLISGAEMLGGGVPSDPMVTFLSRVVGATEGVWSEVLPEQAGIKYQPAPLVVYDGATRSGCGGAISSRGPFYCPIDKKVYLDTSFFRDVKTKYGGGGDAAYSYVVAHEIGHHVQDLLGILDKVEVLKQRVTRIQANAISVRYELQADCLAGVWAARANIKWQILEAGDVEQAVATAEAVGDDKLQTAARGYTIPDSFTHGTSAQRVKWLMTGLKSGRIASCDTFSH
jgi:uncharacterized protein